jgi:hypothetical protein
MKLFQVVKDITVNTDFGPHSFVKGQTVEFLGDEIFPLVQAGYIVPFYAWDEARQMKGKDPDLLEFLHQIKTLFPDSHIIQITSPFEISDCRDVPTPYGSCNSFDMRVGPDQTLWPYCRKGKSFCPNAASRKEVKPDAK